jgi:hypothetical protein
MHLVLSQEARPYAICLASLLVMLVLFVRAFERPTWKRVASFGVGAYLSTLTRTFTPLVFLLTTGVVLTLVLARQRQTRRDDARSGSDDVVLGRRACRRLWLATLSAGLAALPMLVLLIPYMSHSAFATGFVPNAYGIDTAYGAKLLTYAGVAHETIWASYGPVVVGLALGGVVLSLLRWGSLTPSTRCTLGILASVGPVFLLVYTLVGGVHYLYGRYNFYLMPIVAVFAAIALVPILRRLTGLFRSGSPVRWPVLCIALASVFGYPMVMSADEMGSYRRRDWRGCAAYLGQRVMPDDVIMVLTDDPFGRTQHRFFGKYEWPADRRPLAEAMWTLAISDAHFRRLCAQKGRVYTVIAYGVEPQGRDAYLSCGLSAAPEGYDLVKFRGLDLLIREDRAGSVTDQVLAGCDDLLQLAHADESTRVIPLILRSRVYLESGQSAEASQLCARARALVPEKQVEYFEHATAGWRQCTDAITR